MVCGRYSDFNDEDHFTVAGTAPASHRIPLYGCSATHRRLVAKIIILSEMPLTEAFGDFFEKNQQKYIVIQ
jgi:hypothetical protein